MSKQPSASELLNGKPSVERMSGKLREKMQMIALLKQNIKRREAAEEPAENADGSRKRVRIVGSQSNRRKSGL
jgi:hypothetical protein